MATEPVLAGRMVIPEGRPPRQSTGGRICVVPDCQTRLSIYNLKETCFRHSPIRYPRIRGRSNPHQPRLQVPNPS